MKLSEKAEKKEAEAAEEEPENRPEGAGAQTEESKA